MQDDPYDYETDYRKRPRESFPYWSRMQLYEKIAELPDVKLRAWITIIYLSGSRISEICRKMRARQVVEDETDKENDPEKMTIKLSDIAVSKKTKPEKRTVYVIREDKLERAFFDLFLEYFEDLAENDYIIPYNRFTMYKKIRKNLGTSIHHLRHLRAYHLVTDFDFTEAFIKEYFRWSRLDTAAIYVRISGKMVKEKMRKGAK